MAVDTLHRVAFNLDRHAQRTASPSVIIETGQVDSVLRTESPFYPAVRLRWGGGEAFVSAAPPGSSADS